jgi:hypothetical protein
LKRYYKGIYHGKGFAIGLLEEFAAVGGLILFGFAICVLIARW